MGQSVSHVSDIDVATIGHGHRRRVSLPYVALSDGVTLAETAPLASSTEDGKDMASKLLDFNRSLSSLPDARDPADKVLKPSSNAEVEFNRLVKSVDSVEELFQYISELASAPSSSLPSLSKQSTKLPSCGFEARIAWYVHNLQQIYQTTKKEKARYEQQRASARALAASQRKVMPAPLPLPTQSCLSMGWELVIHLLRATRSENLAQYMQALDLVKKKLHSIKPTAYADSSYVAPTASSAFNDLCNCLRDLAGSSLNGSDMQADAKTIETLTEVALARGSLPTLLFVVRWLMQHPSLTKISLHASIDKLAAIKEQPMYGKWEVSGELYCCGQNSYGELGTGDDLERHQLCQISLAGWKNIRQLASGNELLTVLTDRGVLLTCGLNKSGQCGQGHFDERVMMLRPVAALRHEHIKFIAASNGCEHLIAVTATGKAYSWGYNDRGQLGHENALGKASTPKLIEALKHKKVVQAAVSYHHSAVITDKGALYTFGMNDCGQLGLDTTHHQAVPHLVKALSDQHVATVACGLYHTVIVTTTGALLTCGKNDYGQLGLGHNRQVKVPTTVTLQDELASFIACGYYHTVVVTTNGKVYSFGRNDYGQLGVGNKVHQSVPTPVVLPGTMRIVRAASGCYHTVLLSEQGEVFTFGRNNKGQLGNRGSTDALLPIQLKVRPERSSRRCLEISAGFYTTSLLVERKKENDDSESTSVPEQDCLATLCGRVEIDRSGEIDGLSNFGSVAAVGVNLFDGVWFYEVEVVSSGLIQIGWIDGHFQGSSDQGEGVGDHAHSWSYDGNRQRRWNCGSSQYGEKWQAGDVIGCLLDLSKCEMSFFRNGISLGVAFDNMKCNKEDLQTGLMPGISLERGEIIRVNLGHYPFAFPPPLPSGFEPIVRAMGSPCGSVVLKDMVTNGDCPPKLTGHACVRIGTKLFVVGGCVVSADGKHSSEPCARVWAFDETSGSWEKWTDFPMDIRNHQVVAIGEDQILVLGGECSTAASRHMDLYKIAVQRQADGSLPEWQLVQATIGAASSLPPARSGHVCAVISMRLEPVVFMYGGRSIEDEVLGDTWVLSMEDGAWSKIPSSLSLDPGPRVHCSSAVIGESIYVFGGQDKDEKLRSDLWRLNMFDRVWYICHDDNITSDDKDNRSHPGARMKYSICADRCNLWIFGGVVKSGAVAKDLWCYSVVSGEWSAIEVECEEFIDGVSSGFMFTKLGEASALCEEYKDDASLYFYAGEISTNGHKMMSSSMQLLTPSFSSQQMTSDCTKHMATLAKPSHVMNVVKAHCHKTRSMETQEQESRYAGTCILAHLYRLLGTDIPMDENEPVQLSCCSYQSLCVDPTSDTFRALSDLGHHLYSELFSVSGNLTAKDSDSMLWYSLLIVIRLLKYNFFEVSRSYLEGEESAFVIPANKDVLQSIQELLFQVIERISDVAYGNNELQSLSEVLKQEAASTISYGFSIMFPSLSDRLNMMNGLMSSHEKSPLVHAKSSELLVTMLIPTLASTKMLFSFMNESTMMTANTPQAIVTGNAAKAFLTTLFDELNKETEKIVQSSSARLDAGTIVSALEGVWKTNYFKCVNVMIRASVYWCSFGTEEAWGVVEHACFALIGHTSKLLLSMDVQDPAKLLLVPVVLHKSYSGKLLSFMLLSILSLPSVRKELSTRFDGLWNELQVLSADLHALLLCLQDHEATQHSCSVISNLPHTADEVLSSLQCSVQLSGEMTSYLALSNPSVVTYDDVLSMLWTKISRQQSFKANLLRASEDAWDLYRVSLPSELVKLLGCQSILVKIRKNALTTDVGSVAYSTSNISFDPSRMVLSQHVYVQRSHDRHQMAAVASDHFSSGTGVSRATSLVPPSPGQQPKDSLSWLKDLQMCLSWAGSHFASSLISEGKLGDELEGLDTRWHSSLLLKGGLDNVSTSDSVRKQNQRLLQQILDNTGPGKRLVDSIRQALDPGANTANPALRLKLKRQDSVEAALEKSGGYEAVDRAVRAAFAVLLKHSNVSYTTIIYNESRAPSEPIVSIWRTALQLRRWIVREQQKSGGRTVASPLSSNENTKERQRAQYEAVCQPIVERALVLLRLTPSSWSSSNDTQPLQLLPGCEKQPAYDQAQVDTEQEQVTASEQLHTLEKFKSHRKMEEEDECVQTEVFAFLQAAPGAKLETKDGEEEEKMPEDIATIFPRILLSQVARGESRLKGLRILQKMVDYTSCVPTARSHIISALSTAFKRIKITPKVDANGHITTEEVVEKDHFLTELEFAGSSMSNAIRDEYYALLSSLLKLIEQDIDVINEEMASAHAIEEAATSILQVLEACCLPYEDGDWSRLCEIHLPLILTKLSTWKYWKKLLTSSAWEEQQGDRNQSEVLPILPAAIQFNYPKIISGRNITIGTDLETLVFSHSGGKGLQDSYPGGLVVFDQEFTRGRWYFELLIRSQDSYPVFVGTVPSTIDLNGYTVDMTAGVYLCGPNVATDIINGATIRCDAEEVIGLLLDCSTNTLEVYRCQVREKVLRLPLQDDPTGSSHPAIGLRDAEVHWNLRPEVPVKLWSQTEDYQVKPSWTKGSMSAIGVDGSTLGWTLSNKRQNISLASDCKTIIAGCLSGDEDSYEVLSCIRGFSSGKLYIQVHILSAGWHGHCNLSFGFVSESSRKTTTTLSEKVEIVLNEWDESTSLGPIGILYDFDEMVIHATAQSKKHACSFSKTQAGELVFPTLEACCNGVVFTTDFHPKAQTELPPSVIVPRIVRKSVSQNASLKKGNLLHFQVHSCDGGEYNASHSASNCVTNDANVYSSIRDRNVNLVLKHNVDSPFCLTSVGIRSPGVGFSSPVKNALVFVTSLPPNLDVYQDFDDLTEDEFAALPFGPADINSPRDERLPVAYLSVDGASGCIMNLAYPVLGRYVLVKLLSASGGSNIDVGYIELNGDFDADNGPAYGEEGVHNTKCDECQEPISNGVLYTSKSEDLEKLCASCYDANRGHLDMSYYVHTKLSSSESDDQVSAENLQLCRSRRHWMEKLLNTYGRSMCTDAPTAEKASAPTAQAMDEKQSEQSSVCVFEDCELFSCGQNNYGELCLGHCNSTSKLEHVPMFSSRGVRTVCAGNECLVVVMKDGAVYTCGLNKSGQCGNGTFEERLLLAMPVRALSGIPVAYVAAANGSEHMIAVTTDGSAYSWGYNDRGQLGLGSTISKSHTPRLIESVREQHCIVHAAVSYHHSAIVSSTGDLLTFGMNDSGQLGLDNFQHQHTPQLVEALSGQQVIKVGCGLYHTVAITAAGDVYSFGKNDYGQLGLGHARNVKVPTRVKVLLGDAEEKVIDVNCGYYHTLCITAKGKLITWGRNDYGQLGIGSKEHKNAPQNVPLPLSSKVVKTSCGCYHNLILLANGRVMVFGRNNKGQLGAGARTLPSADLPLPLQTNVLANNDAVAVAAGFYSSYVLTGRYCGDGTNASQSGIQTSDLPEMSCLASSEHLYKSLMTQIDDQVNTNTLLGDASASVKQWAGPGRKALLKLQSAVWAIIRALMYQSIDEKALVCRSEKYPVNACLQQLIHFALDELNMVQSDVPKDTTSFILDSSLQSKLVNSKDVCVGMMKSLTCLDSTDKSSIIKSLSPSFKNQLLWALYACGSKNMEVGSLLASNTIITTQILQGMQSTDQATASLCLRLAMLVFPQLSISLINDIDAANDPMNANAGDVIQKVIVLAGEPHTVRPRLCSHELGVECSSTLLCNSLKCMKGNRCTKSVDVEMLGNQAYESSHTRQVIAAGAVELLRSLMLVPSWKAAVNASLRKALSKSSGMTEMMDKLCDYYENVQNSSAVDNNDAGIQDDVNAEGAVRKAESTDTPEVDDNPPQEPVGDTLSPDEATTKRDHNALQRWKQAKEAIMNLSAIMGATSVVGGHVEPLREGGSVIVVGEDTKNQAGKRGVLVSVCKDALKVPLGKVVFRDDYKTLTSCGKEESFSIPANNLCAVENVPVVLDMFEKAESVLLTLSKISLGQGKNDKGKERELELPNNTPIQVILRSQLQTYRSQLQWRSMKAVSQLLKQIPTAQATSSSTTTELVCDLASLLTTQSAVFTSRPSLYNHLEQNELSSFDARAVLQKKWLAVKQRQMVLDVEQVVDTALDGVEEEVQHEVVCQFGEQNAFTWGPDALQSPRRKFAGSKKQNTRTLERPAHKDESQGNDENVYPDGAWGMLQPLPPLNETDAASLQVSGLAGFDMAPYPLMTQIVRVGRAVDSCDLVVNDRSVSGRHFHIRRLSPEENGGTTAFELQDFSKNGTIVNGVRVHGTSIQITPGARIALILSRGGLVTYEFQARSSDTHTTVRTRRAPPSITTSLPPLSGQEYQQTPTAAVAPSEEPRSPSEMQNRGVREQNRTPAASQDAPPANELRIVTSIAESDVPRALISPNPAVDSPRAGGFNSPRSMVLQQPGTPSVRSSPDNTFPTMMPAPVVLSPASAQQRESSQSEAPAPRYHEGGGGLGETLRMILGRGSVQRNASRNQVTRTTQQSSAEESRTTSGKGLSVSLSGSLPHPPSNTSGSTTPVTAESAFAESGFDEAEEDGSQVSLNAHQMSLVFGINASSCDRMLQQSGNDIRLAAQMLMNHPQEDSSDVDETCSYLALSSNSNDVMMGIHEGVEENPSYALCDTIQTRPDQRRLLKTRSPHKATGAKDTSTLSLWRICGGYNEHIQSLNWCEVEQEQTSLAYHLSTLFAEDTLMQLTRLAADTDAKCLNVLNDERILRLLVTMSKPAKEPSNFSTTVEADAKTNRIRVVLARLVNSTIMSMQSETMISNLNSIDKLTNLSIELERAQSSDTQALESLLRHLMSSSEGSEHLVEDLAHETVRHILSRSFSSLSLSDAWTVSSQHTLDARYPKGPLTLSCGLDTLVTNGFERMWGIPSADPLVKYRHQWRKKAPTASKEVDATNMKTWTDQPLSIWRPCLPLDMALPRGNWVSLGDVITCGIDPPERPVLFVLDRCDGSLMPPKRFHRVDVTGAGLPMNSVSDDELERKQIRSLWVPIAPTGYVALGCVAGSKDDPMHPPDVDSIRCIHEDLVNATSNTRCVWRATTQSVDVSPLVVGVSSPKNQLDGGQQEEEGGFELQTSLWSIDDDFVPGILPIVTANEDNASQQGYTLALSAEDHILCAPVSIQTIKSFVNALLLCCKESGRTKEGPKCPIPSELCTGLLALVKQLLCEKPQGNCKHAVELLRTLISLIQRGCPWQSKEGLLYCRSMIMALMQDQEGGLMYSALLQAFVELMLAVNAQNVPTRREELADCVHEESDKLSLPYQFHFKPDLHSDRVLSHSSQLHVARQNAVERKFVVKYNAASIPAAADPTPSFCSCRFEHTPELVVSLKNSVKAEIVYFEVTVQEIAEPGGNPMSIGFSTSSFNLEGPCVGTATDPSPTYAYLPSVGKPECSDASADLWKWKDTNTSISAGDVVGCGLRVDTREMFVTKNGRLLGIAFASISNPRQLHPTVSISTSCQLLINFGSPIDKTSLKPNFSFRFSSLDYDNLMVSFDWFEQLMQVYSVMQSLMERDKRNDVEAYMPSEFLLSADNFLSDVCEDICVHVESTHPYDTELLESTVSMPLATSIRLKLDQASDTANVHCLQILQGGETNESNESEVRAFTGACGGQEVTIDGDSFVWRFPVQSNFQCRVDRVRKGPYLQLENRDTRLSLSRDKGWQTAIGVARFESGVHIWEVRITFVTASSNIFLGVARRDVRLDSYLGKDNRGWGWIGNRALWNNGSKQRGTYGEKFKTGDVVRMTLDLRRGTLSYALNGRDLGVAFGPGGTGPKLEGVFYPGFALYNQRDCIDLIGGHRVEDSAVEGSFAQTMQEMDEAYDEMHGEDLEDLEEGTPHFRMELASTLSQLGFPVEWCLYALRHCEDDMEQAADFVLANMPAMEDLVRDEAELLQRRARRRELAAEHAAAATEDTSLTDADHRLGSGESTPSPIRGHDSAADDKASSSTPSQEKWGIGFMAVPEFSLTGRRLLSVKYADKLHELQTSQAIFTKSHDEALVQIVNDICEARAEALLTCDPLRMSPEEIELTSEHYRQYPILQGMPLSLVQKRFLVLRNFNCRLQNSLSLIDLSVSDGTSLLAQGAKELRGLIFQNVKLAWWLSILKEQQSPAASRPEIEVDRQRARVATAVTGAKDTVFAQVFDQLQAIQPPLLRCADRAFKCQFVGEFGDDFGGLYRECVAHMSSELQSNMLQLLKPSPNALHGVGENREVFVPNVHLRKSPRLIKMAEFLGELMGIAIRTKTPLDLNLPRIIWKRLVEQSVDEMDVQVIHQDCFQVVETINNIALHGVTESMFEELIDTTFSVLSSAQESVELIPAGHDVHVTWDDKEDYAEAVKNFRLNEFDDVCEDIARGLATMLPAPTLSLMTWRELMTLVCGKPSVDVGLLRRRTTYGDGCQASDAHIGYFWEVLDEFSEVEKSSFLRFVWGRSRLPTHAADFTQDFKISGLPRSVGKPDSYLPIAHTCFFSLDLPAYTSKKVLYEKLLYAITNCLSVDADNTTVAQRAGQGLNWSTATATAAATAATATVTNVIAGVRTYEVGTDAE